MTNLIIDEDILLQLEASAERENRSANDVLRALLAGYDLPKPPPSDWLRFMATRTSQPRDILWRDEPELSTRSRQILEDEFADELMKRLQPPE